MIPSRKQPVFTGRFGTSDNYSKTPKEVAPSGGPVFDKIGPETVFVDGNAGIRSSDFLISGTRCARRISKEISVRS